MSKILLVDDERDIHEIMRAHLEQIEGVEMFSAYTGEEGVARYRELLEAGERPAMVIMDLNLSGGEDIKAIDLHMEGKDNKMDGVRAAQEILAMDPEAAIWGYTAWFGTPWAEKLKDAGTQKVVERTLPFREFARMVESFLNK